MDALSPSELQSVRARAVAAVERALRAFHEEGAHGAGWGAPAIEVLAVEGEGPARIAFVLAHADVTTTPWTGSDWRDHHVYALEVPVGRSKSPVAEEVAYVHLDEAEAHDYRPEEIVADVRRRLLARRAGRADDPASTEALVRACRERTRLRLAAAR